MYSWAYIWNPGFLVLARKKIWTAWTRRFTKRHLKVVQITWLPNQVLVPFHFDKSQVFLIDSWSFLSFTTPRLGFSKQHLLIFMGSESGFYWPGMFQHCHQGAFSAAQEQNVRNLQGKHAGDLLRRSQRKTYTGMFISRNWDSNRDLVWGAA